MGSNHRYYQSHQSGIETVVGHFALLSFINYQSHQSGIETWYVHIMHGGRLFYQSHQSGIETEDRSGRTNADQTTNRTNLELKRVNDGDNG